MLEKDYELAKQAIQSINGKYSFEPMDEDPYKNIARIQKKCSHMWANDTDAIYVSSKGKRKCAICGKEF